MPPKSRICDLATSCPGWPGSPGYRTDVTAGWSASTRATRAAFAQCRSIRAARVLTPRSVSQASNGPATAPVAFWLNARSVGVPRVLEDDGAAHHVRVTAEVLGGGVDDDVRAQVERALQVGRGERVVHHEQRAVARGRARRAPGCRRSTAAGSWGFRPRSAGAAARPRPRRRRRGRSAGRGCAPPPTRSSPCRTGGTCRRRRRRG